jgi:dTDP-glucose 4,6-dehydratase
MSATHTPRSMLVTGGAGFIGSNFVRHVLAVHRELRVTTLDALTYAGRVANLGDAFGDPRHRFVEGDIGDGPRVFELLERDAIDTVVHFAAESHVDRSIIGPARFIETNVVGTFTLLEAAREAWARPAAPAGVRFHHVSTDEVFGSLDETDPPFSERTTYAPRSPYSASKAGSDHLVGAYHHTYELPVTMTNCSNNYGPRQHAEKLIPTIVRACVARERIPLYGTGQNVRDWLYVDDHCRAVDLVVRCGRDGETYLVGGGASLRNLDLAREVCATVAAETGIPVGELLSLIELVPDRPGHDFRYAIDASKIARDLGWRPAETFASGIVKTVRWYLSEGR